MGWERIGERIGNRFAALVLGIDSILAVPHSVIERRTRHAILTEFHAWCALHDPVTLASSDGTLRRAITFMTARGTIPAEVELDAKRRRATIVASTLQRQPSFVAVICRPEHWGRGRRYPYGEPPLASHVGSMPGDPGFDLHAFSETLDKATCQALVDAIGEGPLAQLEEIDIDVHADRLDVLFAAPSTARAWHAVAAGIIALSEWLVERAPPSYRR